MTTTALRIEVVDEAGQPVKEAIVVVAKSSVPFPEIALIADDAGAVQLQLPPGTFVLRANGQDGRQGEATASTPADGIASILVTIR